jgi:hypothetical protein
MAHNEILLRVDFLPWAGLKKSLSIGPVDLWPYYQEATTRVADPQIRAHLDEYFSCWVDQQGIPVDTITVCSHGQVDFRQLMEEADCDIADARNALAFAGLLADSLRVLRALSAKHKTWTPAAAEQFRLVTYKFRPGLRELTQMEGGIAAMSDMTGVRLVKPPTILGGPLCFDEWLATGFDNCFPRGAMAKVRERLFRALDWFRLAHVVDRQPSTLTRVVMMATAFETLLDLPRNNKSGKLAEEVDRRVASDTFTRESRRLGNDEVEHTVAGWWAYDFYKLRNDIVHGETVGTEALTQGAFPQLLIADLVFGGCVARALSDHACVALPTSLFTSSGDGMTNAGLAWMMGSAPIHKVLGWAASEEGPQPK